MTRKCKQTGLIQRKSSSAQSEKISSYILIFKFDYKLNSQLLQCFFLYFLISPTPPLMPFSYFILYLSFHFCPPRVEQIVGVDLCHISTFLKSLESSSKVENYCLGITSSLMRLESWLQNIQCSGSNFLLDISYFLFVSYVHNVYRYHQNFQEGHPG